MGNKISKSWSDSFRSCKNVTCFDNCKCLRCWRQKQQNVATTLEITNLPYIDGDEVGKQIINIILIYLCTHLKFK